MSMKQIEHLKTLREEMDITESADRAKARRAEYEAMMAEQKNKEHQGKQKKTVKKPVRPIEPISVRIEKIAIKTLGEDLRAFKTEPVTEVARGDEEIWKLPCKEYHIECWRSEIKLADRHSNPGMERA